MENTRELRPAETDIQHAQRDIRLAEAAEHAAAHQMDDALGELREAEHLNPDEILLEIATPKGIFIGVFNEKATIASVIEVVVDKKGLDKKDTFELVHDEKVLQPTDRTLESFGLKHKAQLELVATGSGV
jgi:hypothetical protein